jgi:2-dehydropantoate 2-reductase
MGNPKSRMKDVDTSNRQSSSFMLNNYAERGAKETAEDTQDVTHHAIEHDAGDKITTLMTSEENVKVSDQPVFPNGKTPSAFENIKERNLDLPSCQATISDAKATLHILETALNPDPRPKQAVSRTIYILGSNAVGKFIAHALAGAPKAPPVTILLHHPSLVTRWYQEGSSIRLLKGRRIDEKHGIKVEPMDHFYPMYPWGVSRFQRHIVSHEPRETIIDNLIVTTQGHTTITALTAIRHRLRPSSTICFMHESVAIINYVNSSVFPDANQRPSYILGSISHTIHSMQDKYSIVQQRAGRISLTAIPGKNPTPHFEESEVPVRRMDISWPPSSKYLMRAFHLAPDLCATALHCRTFYKDELEKLAVTSIHGPVSVVYECFSDQLLYNREASQSIKALANEVSLILRSLPELSSIASLDYIFSSKRLERLVLSATEKSGKNRSTMLMEANQGKETKIDFYNGYLLRRAKELRIDCPRLEMITSMVKGKQVIRKSGKDSYIPFRRPMARPQ